MSDLALMEWPWKDLAEKDAEIDRLRTALQRIAAIEDQYQGSDWQEINEARDIAERALAEPLHQHP